MQYAILAASLFALSGCAGAVIDCERDVSPLASEVMTSLQTAPDEWSSDGYYLRHKDGLSFWMSPGNGAGFISPVQATNHDEWKTNFSGTGSASQVCLLMAYEDWRESRQYEPSLGTRP